MEVGGVVAEEGLAFIDAVTNQLAAALDRHYALRREVSLRERAEASERLQRELLEREQRAHLDLEEAHRRQAFLVEAGALLGDSLDYRASLPRLAHLLVPQWADCCVIDLFSNDPKDPSGTERIALVGSELPAHASPSHLRLLIQVRRRLLGVLNVSSARPGRHGPTDLALFETLAQRIAAAVESAQLYQHAQDAASWREELFAVVSHDIKTPLLAVRLNTEMLLMDAQKHGAQPPLQGRLLESTLQAANQMRELIVGLLDRARLQGMPQPLTPQPQEVKALLEETLQVLQPLALNKSQRLRVAVSPELPRVSADRGSIIQALTNLVGNAIKFTPAHGTLSVRARQVEGMVRFSVKDNGPGIPPADVPHLFERFWRATNASAPGTGLGPNIVKGIVEAHGGTLWVESQLGVGSTFFFTLPVANS